MPPRMDPGGPSGGGVVTANARELRTLAATANNARQEVEDVQRSAGGIIGGLDGRGWNIGDVMGKWASIRGQMLSLTSTLATQALDLQTRGCGSKPSRTAAPSALHLARPSRTPSTPPRAISSIPRTILCCPAEAVCSCACRARTTAVTPPAVCSALLDLECGLCCRELR